MSECVSECVSVEWHDSQLRRGGGHGRSSAAAHIPLIVRGSVRGWGIWRLSSVFTDGQMRAFTKHTILSLCRHDCPMYLILLFSI